MIEDIVKMATDKAYKEFYAHCGKDMTECFDDETMEIIQQVFFAGFIKGVDVFIKSQIKNERRQGNDKTAS